MQKLTLWTAHGVTSRQSLLKPRSQKAYLWLWDWNQHYHFFRTGGCGTHVVGVGLVFLIPSRPLELEPWLCICGVCVYSMHVICFIDVSRIAEILFQPPSPRMPYQEACYKIWLIFSYIYIYIYIYIPQTVLALRGSYLASIVIPLDSRIAGCQPRYLSLGT